MKLQLFEIGGVDWYLAEDEAEAISLFQSDSGFGKFEESIELIEPETIWPMLWDLSDLPQEIHLNPEAVIEPLVDPPSGSGWTHRVLVPARVWSSVFGPGLLASTEF